MEKEKVPFKKGLCRRCDKLGYACEEHTRTEITRRCAIQGLKYCLKNIKKQKSFLSMDCSENHKKYVKVSVKIIGNPKRDVLEVNDAVVSEGVVGGKK